MFTYYQVLEVTPDSDFNHVCSVVCIFHWKDLKTMIVNPIYCNQLKLDAWYCTSFSKTGFLHQFMFRSHLHSILCYKGIYQSKFEHIYRNPLHLCILWCCDNSIVPFLFNMRCIGEKIIMWLDFIFRAVFNDIHFSEKCIFLSGKTSRWYLVTNKFLSNHLLSDKSSDISIWLAWLSIVILQLLSYCFFS